MAWVERKRFEARLLAAELAQILSVSMGGRPQRSPSTHGFSGGSPPGPGYIARTGWISARAMFSDMGIKIRE